MLSDYERETFGDLVRQLEADDPEFVAAFRARKRPPTRAQRSPTSAFLAAFMIVSALLAILLVVLGHPNGALPAVLVMSVLAGLLGAGVGERIDGAS
jgi:hypothetical protein